MPRDTMRCPSTLAQQRFPRNMPTPVCHFGDFRLDVAVRELSRAGRVVATSPAVFDCIAYLVLHRDRAVGRDELVAAVWGKTEVTDAALAKAVLKARRAVGDSGEAQAWIRTIPRFGFRWIGEVREEEPVAESGAASKSEPSSPPTVAPPSNARRRIGAVGRAVAVLLVLVVAAVAGIGWFGPGHHDGNAADGVPIASPDAHAGSERVLAVLPVEVDGAGSDAWLRLGLMDLVANQLRDGGLRVLPSESVVRLADGDGVVDTGVLSDATGAQAWLASSLWRIKSAWRLRMVLTGRDGVVHEIEMRGDNPIEVGRAASRQLLAMLGRPAVPTTAAVELPVAELVQRIEAAMLVDDVKGAEALLRAAPADQRKLPELRLRQAQVDYWSDRTDAAYRELVALDADPAVPMDAVFHARVLTALGSAALALDKADEGVTAFDRAIALLESADSPLRLGRAYLARGVGRVGQGRYREARSDYALARAAFDSIDNPLEIAAVDYCEGYLESRLNRPLNALATYARVAERFQRFGAVMELASVRSNVVATQLDLLRAADAVDTSDANIRLLTRLQNPRARLQVRLSRVTALAAAGRFAEAQELLEGAKPDLDAVGDPLLSAMARTHGAEIAMETGRPEDAYRLARQAIEVPANTGGDSSVRARAWLIVVRALVALERTDEAASEVARFTAWAGASGDEQAALYAKLATASKSGGHSATELHLYRDLLRMAEHDGTPRDVALVSVPYARALMASGDVEGAAGIAGRLVQYADQDFDSALLLLELYHGMGRTDAWRTALIRARAIAGERTIPPLLRTPRGGSDGAPDPRASAG